MRALGVIPARYASTRLPGKPLADLGGRPLVVRVWDRVRTAARLDRVVIATDDVRIRDAAAAAGAETLLTPADLASGSDRAAWTAAALDPDRGFGVVVNIQGDEPFLPADAVDAAADRLEQTDAPALATLGIPLEPGDRTDPNTVKAVVDDGGIAIDFLRGDPGDVPGGRVVRHLGLYAFRREYLERFVDLPPSPRETAERLEQLRALEDGARIAVETGAWPAFGVDTPEDLEAARQRLATG